MGVCKGLSSDDCRFLGILSVLVCLGCGCNSWLWVLDRFEDWAWDRVIFGRFSGFGVKVVGLLCVGRVGFRMGFEF